MMNPEETFDDRPFRFSCIVFPRWQDLDAMGVLNNAVYLTLFEQARWGYFRELGLSKEDNHFPFVLAESTVRFLQPVRDGESLRVFARTIRLGNKSFHMRFAIDSIEKKHRAADGSAALVTVDEGLAPCPIPPAFRDTITAFEGL